MNMVSWCYTSWSYVPMKNPGSRIVGPEADRDKIANGISDIDRIPDYRILIVVRVGVRTPNHPELMLGRTW